jgi:hypothetical protein
MPHRDSSATLNRALLAGWQAPDMLGIGVMVCDASCRVLIANETARRILRGRDGLHLSADGLLCEVGHGGGLFAEVVRKCAEAGTKTHQPESDSAVVIRETVGKPEIELRVRSFRIAGGKGTMALVVLLESNSAKPADALGTSTYGPHYDDQSDLAASPHRIAEHLPRYIEPSGCSKR